MAIIEKRMVTKRPAVKRNSNVTPVKVTTKTTPVRIKDVYSINEDEDGDIDDMIEILNDYIDSDQDFDLRLNNVLKFDCTITELPHCCGIYELGGITFSTFKDEVKFFNALAICKTGKTLMINTINTGQSARLAEVLVKCSNWTCVKTFKNSGSGNTIKIWMSNNN